MTTRPNRGAGVSRYLRLYSVLSQALSEGRIGGGEPLPSEPRLMRDYGVSRSTVRRALARLELEGRILRKRGSGTYARSDGQASTPESLSPILDGTRARPPATTAGRTLAFELIPTPGFLSGEQPRFGATTLLIRQVRYLEREPVVLETAYVPQEIGAGLTRRLGSGGAGILAVLAKLGHRSSTVEREFAALAADPVAANSLELLIGTPVFNERALARDAQGRILAYINLCYRPDRYEARTTIDLGEQRRDRKGRRN